MLIGAFLPDLTIFATLMLLAPALLATGWRWTPIVGALLSALVIAGNSSTVLYDITHPAAFHPFAFMVVAVALALVGTVAGIGATAQNYHCRLDRRQLTDSRPLWRTRRAAMPAAKLLRCAEPGAPDAGQRQLSMGRHQSTSSPNTTRSGTCVRRIS
jgi:hypothetical protein